ncbi:MAG: hypothetical protein J6S27_00900, partial [Thermoguttaceae bacterium]|nr:hypothetical protein [Thermoguttaceae bacterium]
MNRVLATIVFLLLAPLALWAEEATLLERCQEDGMPDEIIFALRKPSTDGHWYGNIGYYAFNDQMSPFPKHSGGRICIYNV